MKTKNRIKNRIKKNKKRKTYKMRGGFSKNIVIREKLYNITLYQNLPENIKDKAKNMCKQMYEGISDEDMSDLVYGNFESSDNNIYILSDEFENIISFIIIKNNICDTCFNCNIICSYIILTCVNMDHRGKGIFKFFLKEIEEYLKHNNINCIRLTAVNKNVFNIYKQLGFQTENKEMYECEYKMIKYL